MKSVYLDVIQIDFLCKTDEKFGITEFVVNSRISFDNRIKFHIIDQIIFEIGKCEPENEA